MSIQREYAGRNVQGISCEVYMDMVHQKIYVWTVERNIWFGGWLKRSVRGVVGWVFVSEKTI